MAERPIAADAPLIQTPDPSRQEALRTFLQDADAVRRLRAQLRAHHEEGITSRGDWPTRHDRRYRRYRADYTLRPMGPWLHAPRIFTSDTRRNVETLLADFWTALFGSAESVKHEPFSEAEVPKAERTTRTHRYLLRHQINDAERGGFSYIAYCSLFDALLDGAGFLKVYKWQVPWHVPEAARGRSLDRIIRIDNVDEGQLLLPPSATGLQYPEAAYVGQQMLLRPDDLLRKRADGFQVPAADHLRRSEPVVQARVGLPQKARDLSERERTQQEIEGRLIEQTRDYIEVVEMYERVVIDPRSGLEEDVVATWYPDADDDHWLARLAYLHDLFPVPDRPLRPLFHVCLWAQPRQLRGLNVVDRLETPQDLINRLTEQLINYGDISMLPFIFCNTMLTGDLPDLRFVAPGTIVPIDNLEGLQFSPQATHNRHFIEELQWQASQIEGDLGVSDAWAGRSPTRPNSPRTLGGTLFLAQRGQQARKAVLELLARQFEALLTFHWQLWQAFAPPGMLVPLRPARPGSRTAPPVEVSPPMAGLGGMPTLPREFQEMLASLGTGGNGTGADSP